MFVFYSGTNVLTANGKTPDSQFLFVPGNNDVPGETWKELMANPNFARRVKSGILKVTSEVEQTEDSSVLAELGVVEAKQMVRDTYDPDLLRRWKGSETRKSVLAVIDEQLEAADKRMDERRKGKKQDEDDGE